MKLKTTSRVMTILVVLSLLLSLFANTATAAKSDWPLAAKAIFFAADGMRPDLMEKYAGEGVMPTYADMMANGVKGENGLVQAFPPNTGVGWYTLATGAYPASMVQPIILSSEQAMLSITAPRLSLPEFFKLIQLLKPQNGLARRLYLSNGLGVAEQPLL